MHITASGVSYSLYRFRDILSLMLVCLFRLHVDAIILWSNSKHFLPTSLHVFLSLSDAVSITVAGGSGPIHLSQLRCIGNESKLVNCPPPDIFFSGFTCSHAVDAGVVCNTGECMWLV